MELWETEIGDTNSGYYFSVEKKEEKDYFIIRLYRLCCNYKNN